MLNSEVRWLGCWIVEEFKEINVRAVSRTDHWTPDVTFQRPSLQQQPLVASSKTCFNHKWSLSAKECIPDPEGHWLIDQFDIILAEALQHLEESL